MSKDKKYNASKRTRAFQSSWKQNYEWLMYDEWKCKMYCEYCKSCPILAGGMDRFRLDPIKAHHSSLSQKACATQFFRNKSDCLTPKKSAPAPVDLANTQCGKMFSMLPESKLKSMRVLFDNATYKG